MRFRQTLRWNDRSDAWKTAFGLFIVILVTLSGYTAFAMSLGTSTPLVVVTSGSMEPALYRGDLLVIQSRSEDQIVINDVIVFWADWHADTPVVHRIIHIVEDENEGLLFVTKGDNNHANDTGERTIDDILGVVVGVIPYLGHVSLFLQTTEGKIVFALLFVLIIAVPEAYERLRNPNPGES